MPRWSPAWNRIELDGPFATGTHMAEFDMLGERAAEGVAKLAAVLDRLADVGQLTPGPATERRARDPLLPGDHRNPRRP